MSNYLKVFLAASLMAFCSGVFAQQSAKINELLQLGPKGYKADRTNAYEDPYYGLKYLIYGKSICRWCQRKAKTDT